MKTEWDIPRCCNAVCKISVRLMASSNMVALLNLSQRSITHEIEAVETDMGASHSENRLHPIFLFLKYPGGLVAKPPAAEQDHTIR